MTDEEKISRRYREMGAEEPPRALDAAILAAARRSALPWTKRWAVPLSLAAVVVLSVTVTLRIQHEQPGLESPVVPEAPLPPAPAARTAPEAGKEAPTADRKVEKSAPAAPRASPVPRAAPAPAVPEPRPFATDKSASAEPARDDLARSSAGSASGELARQVEEGRAREESAARQAPMAQAAPAPLAAKPMPLRERPVELAPEKELERIAELRKQERHDEADKALAEFRKRHPDYRISGAMRERVERR